jgi:hypothetical protein
MGKMIPVGGWWLVVGRRALATVVVTAENRTPNPEPRTEREPEHELSRENREA